MSSLGSLIQQLPEASGVYAFGLILDLPCVKESQASLQAFLL
uniref:Uncharacterized protein n=1 Tax=Electrophorus electricus TaxID=8005 RepID=A0A4W4EZV4_ELEEL